MSMCPRAQFAKNVTWVTLTVHIVGARYFATLYTYYVRALHRAHNGALDGRISVSWLSGRCLYLISV